MNSYLNKQLEFAFGKSYEEMTEEEINKITEITLAYKDFKGDITGISISILSKFPNLKKCLISNFELNDDDIEVLKSLNSLKGIQFSGCDFSDVTYSLGDMELVVIDCCANLPNDFFKKSNSLRLFRAVNQKYFDVACLNNCKALEEVYLQRSTLVNLIELSKLPNLRLANLNCSKFNFLTMTKLKRLGTLNIEYKKDATPDYSR